MRRWVAYRLPDGVTQQARFGDGWVTLEGAGAGPAGQDLSKLDKRAVRGQLSRLPAIVFGQLVTGDGDVLKRTSSSIGGSGVGR